LNFVIGLSYSLIAPFILSRTDNNSATLALFNLQWHWFCRGGLLICFVGRIQTAHDQHLYQRGVDRIISLVLVFGLGQSVSGLDCCGAFWANLRYFYKWSEVRQYGRQRSRPRCAGRVLFRAPRSTPHGLSILLRHILAGLLADYVTEPAMSRDRGWRIFWSHCGRWPRLWHGRSIHLDRNRLHGSRICCVLVLSCGERLEDHLPDHDRLEKIAA